MDIEAIKSENRLQFIAIHPKKSAGDIHTMRLRNFTPLLFAITFFTAGSCAEAGIPIIWGQGPTVAKVADLPAGHPLLATHGAGTAVGYKYERFHVYWCDLWTWSGEFCLYNDRGHLPLGDDPKKAAEIVGMLSLSKPLLYHFPLGWIVIACLVFGSVILETLKKRNSPAARLDKMLLDPDYQDAAKLLATSKDGEARALDHLIGRGIEPKTAAANLSLLVAQIRYENSRNEEVEAKPEADEPL